MNFCVVYREIRESNKRGGQNKLRGVFKNHEKINVPPPFILNLRVTANAMLAPRKGATPTNKTAHIDETVREFFFTFAISVAVIRWPSRQELSSMFSTILRSC